MTNPETSSTSREATIPAGDVSLAAQIDIPEPAHGVVVFAHGSGSSRSSPRNRFVARTLREGSLATVLVDLLTPDEEAVDLRTRHLRFDIPRLAERIEHVVDWLETDPDLGRLHVGLFGASTGAAAALIAAAERPQVDAVVSRGGRVDLAGDALPLVRAPTLLLVGERDGTVLALNEQSRHRMRAPVQLAVVQGATHLFEEPGALRQVASLARDWFERHL